MIKFEIWFRYRNLTLINYTKYILAEAWSPGCANLLSMISAVSQHAQWSPATLPRTFRCFHCRGETFVTSHCGTLCLPVTYRVLLNTRLMLCYPWALELSSTIPLSPMCVSGRWLHIVFSCFFFDLLLFQSPPKNNFTSSYPHHDIYTFCYWQIFWHSIWHIFWHFIWHIFWHSIWHIFWHSTWHIFCNMFWHMFWHIFWHSIWHIFWHIFWHSIWHSIWQIFWHMFWQTFWHFIWHTFWHSI